MSICVLFLLTACAAPTPKPAPPLTPTRPTVTPAPSGSKITFEFTNADSKNRAVAFHSLDLIDAKAHSIQTITFGTPHANSLQVSGWSENQADPAEGQIQWANGDSRVAMLALDVPPSTEGILVRMATAGDETGVDVALDGVKLGSLHVTREWRTGYVPVGQAKPVAAANRSLQWQADRYFPAFPSQSGRIYAIHVRTEFGDWRRVTALNWRINQSYDTMMAFTLVGMQGVINRSNPGVYLVWEQPESYNQSPRYYLEQLKGRADVVELDLDGLSAIQFLYRRYAALFQGTVVYDPAVPDSLNLATIYAGLENRLILAPQQLELAGIPRLESVLDLRPLAEQNHWDATIEGETRLYRWVYDNLWPRLEHRAVAIFSPGPPTSRQVPGADNYLPFTIGARDYAIALNLPILWLSPSDEPQASLINQFLADAPTPIPVFGFFGSQELDTVRLISRHGDFCPVITNGNNPLGSANLSLHAALPIQPARYQAELNPDRIMATLTATHIVAFFTSDGDSTQYLMDRGFQQMVWEKVQGHRFGWTINPVLPELAPLVWNDYVEHRKQVALLTGPSGAGYVNPGVMDEAGLKTYLERTGRYMDRTGLRIVSVDSRDFTWDKHFAGLYYNTLHPHGLLGTIVGGGEFDQWGLGFRYAGAPTPGAYFAYEPVSSADTWIIDDLLGKQPGGILIDAAHYDWAQGKVVQDSAAAGGEALVFTSDQPTGWIQGPFAELPPGNYTVTFRLKMEDNTSRLPIARLYVGEVRDPPPPPFISREITPRDFRPGQYQDFTLTFTVREWASRVELGLIPYNGANWSDREYASASLWADSVRLSRQGGLDFPVFSMMALIVTKPVEPDAPLLIDKMESAGILVLTPDEYLAALNPEYMIEFATSRLGADNKSLAQAQALLKTGKFFESLLTVRNALKSLPHQ